MRPFYYCYLIILITFAVLLRPTTAAARLPFIFGQDDNQTTTSTIASKASVTKTASASISGSATAAASSFSKESDDEPSSTADAASSTNSAAAASDASETLSESPAAISSSPTATATAAPGTNGQLPIHPKVTPAVGLSGVVLIITGLVYGAIGFRNRWLYIFFSAAHLTSIAITVLIVYLMNPPVSNAVQGAFFVAVVITGCLVGGLSLLFQEITEGFCCALGGFCLAMWFLCLKEGGLIQSVVGRVIFIICLMLPMFALSLSAFTKTYASIGNIAFAGGTAIVLGIDCFSRAGLKEFWLYIWALNDDVFPLNTKTYPMTRGIRVEIAAIVLFAIVGVVSQLKLWKLVEKHKVAKRENREEQQRDLAQLEADVGRRIQDTNAREMAEWEAAYGDKQLPSPKGSTSTDTSLMKKKPSVTSREVTDSTASESVELNDLGKPKDEKPLPAIVTPNSVENEHEDRIQRVDQNGKPIASIDGRRTPAEPRKSSSIENERTMQPGNRLSVHSQLSGSQDSVDPPPRVVPLPIPIPREHGKSIGGPDSTSTLKENTSRWHVPNRLSSSSNRLSALRTQFRASSPVVVDERLLSPASTGFPETQEDDDYYEEERVIEDDWASSVVATLDDREELGTRWSRSTAKTFPAIDNATNAAESEDGDGERTPTGAQTPARMTVALGQSGSDAESQEKADSLHGPDDKTEKAPQKEDEKKGRRRKENKSTSSASNQTNSAASEGRDDQSSKASTKETSNSSTVSGPEESLLAKLPAKPSKVARIYRTNEWAKHAVSADKPEPDDLELAEPESPGIKVEHGFVEASAPVRVEALLESVPAPDPSGRVSIDGARPSLETKRRSIIPRHISVTPTMGLEDNSSSPTTYLPYRQNSKGGLRSPNQPRVSFEEPQRAVLSRNPSSASVNMSGHGIISRQSSFLNRGRSVTMPIAEQPIEEAAAVGNRARMVETPPPFLRNSTLLQKRESMVRSRVTSMAFNASSVPAASLNGLPHGGELAGLRHVSFHEAITDDMPLSERRALLQLQQHVGQRPTSLVIPNASVTVSGGAGADFDSHQPKRDNAINPVEQAERYAKWRESTNNLPKLAVSPSPGSGPAGDGSEQVGRFAKWRQSTHEMMNPSVPATADERRRSAMLTEQRHREVVEQAKEEERKVRESMMDQMMRRGDMQDLHREHLRKMQAKANRAVQ